MELTSSTAKIRLISEICMEFGAILYIFAALREARFLGLNMFIENLVRYDFAYELIDGTNTMINFR